MMKDNVEKIMLSFSSGAKYKEVCIDVYQILAHKQVSGPFTLSFKYEML